jgi:hypothetical protein
MGAKIKKHPQKKNPANVSLLALYVGIVVVLTEARVRALQGLRLGGYKPARLLHTSSYSIYTYSRNVCRIFCEIRTRNAT